MSGKTVFLFGSRQDLGVIPEAAAEVAKAGFDCTETKFFMSIVYTCDRQ